MNRRSFLALLGFAPAAPVLAKIAPAEPEGRLYVLGSGTQQGTISVAGTHERYTSFYGDLTFEDITPALRQYGAVVEIVNDEPLARWPDQEDDAPLIVADPSTTVTFGYVGDHFLRA